MDSPMVLAPEEMVTMEPPPRAVMNGMAWRARRRAPRGGVSMARSHTPRSTPRASLSRRGWVHAALWSTQSTTPNSTTARSTKAATDSFPRTAHARAGALARPWWFPSALWSPQSPPPNSTTARSTKAATDSFRRTSQTRPMALPPEARTSSATAEAPSCVTSPTATDAPSAAKRSAVARPMSEAPPLSSTTLPSSCPISVLAPGHRRPEPGDEVADEGRQRERPDVPGCHAAMLRLAKCRCSHQEFCAERGPPSIGPGARRRGSIEGMRVHRTFAFVDVSGFTALTELEGDERAVDVLTAFRAILRDICSRRGVRIAKWLGDGVMLVCVDTRPLLETILEMHHIVNEVSGPVQTVSIRSGITSGNVILMEGDDYVGHCVNVASRLCDLAAGGEALADPSVMDQDRKSGV